MMRGALWDEQCVITIAKFAAKLKTLVNNLPKAVSECIATDEGRCASEPITTTNCAKRSERMTSSCRGEAPGTAEESQDSSVAGAHRCRDALLHRDENVSPRHLPPPRVRLLNLSSNEDTGNVGRLLRLDRR